MEDEVQRIELEVKEEQDCKTRIVEQGVRVLNNIQEIQEKIQDKVNVI